MGLARLGLAEGGGEHLDDGCELVDGAVHALEVDGQVGGPLPLALGVGAVLRDGHGEEGRRAHRSGGAPRGRGR